jgi:hypothetical protein
LDRIGQVGTSGHKGGKVQGAEQQGGGGDGEDRQATGANLAPKPSGCHPGAPRCNYGHEGVT